MARKREPLDELETERARLLERRAEIGHLLATDDTPTADIANLSREQADIRVTLAALEPRLERARRARKKADDQARQDALAALRPQERADMLAFGDACDAAYLKFLKLAATWRDEQNAGGAPLCGVPAELVNLLKPPLNETSHHWRNTIRNIRV